jgi:type VI secretion system secreted protein Hcp
MAQVDYFLKIDRLRGRIDRFQAQERDRRRELELGRDQSGTHSGGGGGGAGKVSMQDFHFVMRTNKASPKLMLACASGQHIKEAALSSCRKAGGSSRST